MPGKRSWMAEEGTRQIFHLSVREAAYIESMLKQRVQSG